MAVPSAASLPSTDGVPAFDHGATWSRHLFSAHHSPAPYFDDIQAHHSSEDVVPSRECREKVLPTGTTGPDDMSSFDAALASGQVARFNMVIPNDRENGRDLCGTHDAVRQFDDFLSREVPKIESSPASGLIVVWDEGDDAPYQPRHVGALFAGPRVRPGVDARRFSHYSLLRTLADGFGIHRHLAHAAAARPNHWHLPVHGRYELRRAPRSLPAPPAASATQPGAGPAS